MRRADILEQAAAARGAGPACAARGLSLTIRGLRKSFGDNEVLRGIDLHIPAGQFVAIVGRSGCGKSTLLRLIAGLETPIAGTIASAMSDAPRSIRTRDVSGAAAAAVGAGARPMSRSASAATAARPTRNAARDRRLREVGLDDKRGQWPAVLSGGQKQRVALARALVSHPRVLAFDEPLGALDALTRISMQRLLERVWRDQGFTAILVTHDVAEAVTLADRVLVIEDGRIALDIESIFRARGSAARRICAALEGAHSAPSDRR